MRKLIFFILLCFVFNGNAQTNCKPLLEKAQGEYNDGDLKQALILLQKADLCDWDNGLVAERRILQDEIFKAIETQKEEALKARDDYIRINKQKELEKQKANTATLESKATSLAFLAKEKLYEKKLFDALWLAYEAYQLTEKPLPWAQQVLSEVTYQYLEGQHPILEKRIEKKYDVDIASLSQEKILLYSFSKDHKFIQSLELLDIVNGTTKKIANIQDSLMSIINVEPNGYFWSVDVNNNLIVWNLKGDIEAKSRLETVSNVSISLRYQKIIGQEIGEIKLYELSGDSIIAISDTSKVWYDFTFLNEDNVLLMSYKSADIWNVEQNRIVPLVVSETNNLRLKISPDSSILLIYSGEGNMTILNSKGQNLRTIDFRGMDNWLNRVQYMSNVDLLFDKQDKKIYTYYYNTVKVWDYFGHPLDSFQVSFNEGIGSMDLLNDSIIILHGISTSREVEEVWQKEDNEWKYLTSFGTKEDNRIGIDISPDKENILTYSSKSSRLKLWNIYGDLQFDFGHQPDDASFISFSSSSPTFLVRYRNLQAARLYNLDGKLLYEFDLVENIRFNERGDKIIVFSFDNIEYWNFDGFGLANLIGKKKFDGWFVKVSLDGERILEFTKYDTRLYSVEKDIVKTITGGITRMDKDFGFSSNNQFVVLPNIYDKAKIDTWDMEGEFICSKEFHDEPIKSIDYSLNNDLVLTCSVEKCVIWRFNDTSKVVLENKVHFSEGSFIPKSNYVLTYSFSDSTITIWNREGIKIGDISGYRISIDNIKDIVNPRKQNIVLVDKSKRIANTIGYNLKIYNFKGKLLKSFKAHKERITSVRYSPKFKYIMSISEDGTTKVWDSNGRFKCKVSHKEKINDAIFTPDEKAILTLPGDIGPFPNNAKDITPILWDLDGNEIMRFVGHSNGIREGGFIKDGKFVYTVSEDHQVFLWNRNGSIIAKLKIDNFKLGFINFVNITPDENNIIVGYQYEKRRMWPLPHAIYNALKKGQLPSLSNRKIEAYGLDK